jgi:hypothetical protein
VLLGEVVNSCFPSFLFDRNIAMSEEKQEYEKLVVDAGRGNNFALSDMAFIDGIFVITKQREFDILEKYIKDTGEDWQIVKYDESNPRHNRSLKPADSNHIVKGIFTAGAFAPAASEKVAGTGTALANALIDGSIVEKTLDPAIVNPALLLAADQATEQATATVAKSTVNISGKK